MRGRRAVVCLSGVTPAHAASTGDALSLNADLALAAVRAAAAVGVPRVLLASSAAVYGEAEGPLKEDMACHPVSAYGQAKLEMELAAVALARDRRQAVTVLRIGNVAGADAILGGWREGMEIDTLPDGSTPARSYIGPKTLAEVVYQLCLADDLPEILNVAAPGIVQMGALLDAAGLPWTPRAAGDATVARVVFSTKQLEKRVEFAPKAGSAEGLVAEWRTYLADADG
ncbi:NAD dependent epimerase/dehydratase family protein [Sulfitobacter sp. THAF37]|nr:NAD dependent epimerase/dehydratase family protein [Sulfitobacter sp. THAF37]